MYDRFRNWLGNNMNRRRKLSKKKILVFILIIIFWGMFAFSLIKLLKYFNNNKENNAIKEITNNYIVIYEEEDKLTAKYDIDFTGLKGINKDTVGYLKIDNTDIEYVVVKTSNNDFYLNHNYYKDYNQSGWIFMDYRNKLDGLDKNIIIYGHNMLDGSMFGSLKNIIKRDDNKILLVLENDASFYQVFSTYVVEPEDYYIMSEFGDNSKYLEFLTTIKNRSNYDYQIDVDIKDTILTLSTCNDIGNKRVVVHAKKIIEGE